jgi:hypothetical protein
MEASMRLLQISAAVLIAGGFIYAGCADNANAGSLSSLTSFSLASPAVELVGWRDRYYRRHGAWPRGARRVLRDNAIGVDDNVVVVAPVRPRSCGEYHYWNGVACVDARYTE